MFQRWLTISPGSSVLLIGPRRAGKTTFLKSAFPGFKYVTLDDLDIFDWSLKDAKGLVMSLGKNAIIDEIQRNPRLTIAAKYTIDNLGATLLMTGSSSLGLLDMTADSLAGRVAIYSIPTACWGETDGPPNHSFFDSKLVPTRLLDSSRSLLDAMTFGGFPEIATQDSAEKKDELLRNYRNSYFVRDMMQLSNIENVEGLFAVFNHLARSVGSPLEVSGLSREAGLSQVTTKKYLNALLNSQLVFRLSGRHFSIAKRHIKSAKYYFADNGILHAFGSGVSSGQVVENFVISELEKRRKLGFIKSDGFHYFKTASGREVDLVFEEGDMLRAIEIKSGNSYSPKDISNLRNFYESSGRKTTVSLVYQGTEYLTEGPVKIIPLAALHRGK